MEFDQRVMWDFWTWFALVVLFSAYTINMQRTTRELGRKLVNADSGAGIQDAITPKWQTQNNIIMFALLGLYAFVCFYIFTWYFAIAAWLATFFLAIPLASRVLMPRPMSRHFLDKVQKDLKRRGAEFQAAGDSIRESAIEETLKLLSEFRKTVQ